VVILYEAIYYLRRPEKFASEARRLLRPGGTLLICTANKDQPDFNPSPYSFQYFSPPELVALLQPLGFEVEIFGESPLSRSSLRSRLVSSAKRFAVRHRLIPGTMRGKEILKRLVFGRLVSIPNEIDERTASPTPLTPIPCDEPARGHLVIHCVARVPLA
jgi:SAM-dependent methyltransferase